MTGFQALVIKDGNGSSQNMESYLDTNSNICGATVPTDGAGNILGLAAHPVASNLYASGTAIALGQAAATGSVPVAQNAPNGVVSNTLTRVANTTAYAFGQLIANSATYSSLVPFSWAIAPANGVPVYVVKAKISTSTSGSAGVAITNGTFRLHLWGQSPTVPSTMYDAQAFTNNVPFVNWYGTLDGSLEYEGTDSSIGEMMPTEPPLIVVPGGSSQTIYGYLEARGAFTPTSAETFVITLFVQ